MGRHTKEEEESLRQTVIQALKLTEGKHQRRVAKETGAGLNFVNKIAQEIFPPLDMGILKKMIPVFIENGLKIKFDAREIKRIQELYQEIKQNG